MSSVVFMIYIPSEQHEKYLKTKIKKRVVIKESNEFTSSSSNVANTIQETKQYQNSTNKNLNKLNSKEINEEYKTLYKVLEDILQRLNVTNSIWCNGNDNNYLQITFPLESRDRCEEILDALKEHKIGKLYNSVVSVIPCTIHYSNDGYEKKEDSKYFEETENEETSKKDTAWDRFVSSVGARLTVAQIVEQVKSHATLTFDFICLIVISTVLCATGLVENSNVILLSSMLISPMMGPVMAATFGTVIQDKRLQKIGVQNELLGLGIATLVGFVYGSVICMVTDKYGVHEWPTYEMLSRGELRTLWVGCLIALLSGAAVALGILSDNIASLVGVAISTSLMPPAVNAGLLWSVASVYYIKGNETTRYSSLSYTNYYSENRAVELLTLGAVSICLTFVNIICIYVAGILVFKIKEVAPMASRDHIRRQFWNHDIKIARDFNKILQQDETVTNQSLNDYNRLLNVHNNLFHSMDLTKENTKITVTRSEYTWSPCMDVSNRQTLDELRKLYSNLIKEKSQTIPRNFNFHAAQTRRLSQIFQPPDGFNEKGLDTIQEHEGVQVLVEQENAEDSRQAVCTSKKKFVVTRCNSDTFKPN